MYSNLALCVFDQGNQPTTFVCPLCGDVRTSRLAHRTHLGLTHQCDLRQVRGVQGRREDQVVPLEGEELARWVDRCRRNHRHCGARARSRSQRRQASTSASTPLESSSAAVPEPAASSQAASGGSTTTRRRRRRRRPRDRSGRSGNAAPRQSCYALGASGGIPEGYRSGSDSTPSPGSVEDASLFGDLSPERLRIFEDLVAPFPAEPPSVSVEVRREEVAVGRPEPGSAEPRRETREVQVQPDLEDRATQITVPDIDVDAVVAMATQLILTFPNWSRGGLSES